ncbi:MAG TPA: acyl-CoA dehydrogenase family protein [Alphaproteobacteria bacterium]
MATAVAQDQGTRRDAATVDRLMANARDLAPVLRERAQETSRNRSVPKETIEEFRRADLFDIIKPKKFGGKEIRYDDYINIGIELARGDGSAAWVYTVIVVHELIIALFDEQAQKDIWSDPKALCASSFAPSGKMEPAPGGARVSGRWSFCSGIDNCDWMVFGVFAGMVGTPPHPDLRFVLVPKREGQVIDDWNVLGLCGTGSKSFALDNVFVPEHRIISWGPFAMGAAPFGPGPGCPGTKVHAGNIYKAPMWAIFPFCVTSPATGIARGAFEAFVEQMRERKSAIGGEALSQYAHIQHRVAEAGALIDSSEWLFKRSLRETIDLIEAGKPLSLEHRVRSRRDQGYSIVMATRAAEGLFKCTGGNGLYDTQAVQRGYRDVHAMGQHIAGIWEACAGTYGKVTLGGQVGPTEFY